MTHVYETLFSLDSGYRPQPMLVEGYDVSPDGLVYTIRLRRNVPFHNGKELTSEDVISSLTRWGRIQANGRELFSQVDRLEASDRYTVVFRLKRPIATLPHLLTGTGGAAAIYPKEVVDAAGTGEIKQYIGTGPYRFMQWIPDRFLRITRFPRYAARMEPASGWAGRKTAYVDEIRFIPVVDEAARVAGVEAGDFDVADPAPPAVFSRLRTNRNIQHYTPALSWIGPVLNMKEGIMSDRRVRQAYALVLRPEPALRAGYGDPTFYRVDASLMPKGTPWWSESGCANWYNQGDIARARSLLEAAGYRGQPVRFLASQADPWGYPVALVIKQQMEQAGFVVDLRVSDFATIVRLRNDPKAWDIFVTIHTAWGEPTYYTWLSDSWPGWWENTRKDQLVTQLRVERDFGKRLALWKELQGIVCEEGRIPKIGDVKVYRISTARVQGMTRELRTQVFWNVWLSR
jgi:peptide/nickel transport system substrate-binding protein